MKSVVGNSEYSFWCFISCKVKGVLRVEGGYFEHLLKHVISYIYYMQKCKAIELPMCLDSVFN
jgi:hypothetical protein